MKKWIPPVALLLCCMVWGTTFVAIKKIAHLIDPYLLATLKSLLAVLVLFPMLLITNKKNVFFDKQAIKYGLNTGIILGGIYVIQTLGMQFTSSNHSAFITSSAVIIVTLLLVLTGKQQLNFTQIACIFLIALGLYLLTNRNDNQPYNLGDTITFLERLFAPYTSYYLVILCAKQSFWDLFFISFYLI